MEYMGFIKCFLAALTGAAIAAIISRLNHRDYIHKMETLWTYDLIILHKKIADLSTKYGDKSVHNSGNTKDIKSYK